jgi:hypothetical protein
VTADDILLNFLLNSQRAFHRFIYTAWFFFYLCKLDVVGLSVTQEMEGYICISDISETIYNLIYAKKKLFEIRVLLSNSVSIWRSNSRDDFNSKFLLLFGPTVYRNGYSNGTLYRYQMTLRDLQDIWASNGS